MRLFALLVIVLSLAFGFGACKSSGGKPKTFCDSVCLRDTLKFTGEFKLKPYVYITAKDCAADTLIWSYNGLGVNRKMELADLLGTHVVLNKDYTRCFINDTSYAWLLFNDCSNGRGFSLKLPFNKKNPIARKSSNINNFDPKFSVADNLVAYTDRGNIYVEDMATGKNAMMTFGESTGMDYNTIHETLDSVNVTPARIWVKVKLGKEWKVLEKKITLE